MFSFIAILHIIRMNVLIPEDKPEPWATYNKQLTGHEFCIVCAGKWLVCSGVAPPPP